MISVFTIKRAETAIFAFGSDKGVLTDELNTKFQKKKGKLWTHTYLNEKEHNSTISSTRSGKTVQWTVTLTTQYAPNSLIVGRALSKSAYR